jgi:hypothetical protein
MVGAIAPATCAGGVGAATTSALHHYAFPGIQPTPAALLTVGVAAGAIMLLTALSWREIRLEAGQLMRAVLKARSPQGQPIGPRP